ncbi:MAG: heterodisulfide reductase-related iron-sulfur binding cluster [Desulfohalobiaceae bacterium]
MATVPERPPEQIMREVLDLCSGCDACRYLMEESCLFFPELYRLSDRESSGGRQASEAELRELAGLCTLCDLCPCPNVRADVIEAKTGFVRREGFPLRLFFFADLQKLGEWGTRMPRLVNRSLDLPGIEALVKKAAWIHPSRRVPRIPRESFFRWAERKGLDQEGGGEQSPKVAYFAGCTAGFLFPGVARAAVSVLEHNEVAVHVPPQQCCGMPTLLEGERNKTLQRARFNTKSLLQKVREGYDPVCSCPTCGYLLKVLLQEGAIYSEAYQNAVGAEKGQVKVPMRKSQGEVELVSVNKAMYGQRLRDDGYFAALDPMNRTDLASRVTDMGEYLQSLHSRGPLKSPAGRIEMRAAYFAPCHQREQNIGSPYADLLSRIPGLSLVRVGGPLDCCGMGGSLGMKKTFHQTSIKLGHPLMDKIRAAEPEAVVTDCLSCRLQFEHLLPYQVYHPLEILSWSYQTSL